MTARPPRRPAARGSRSTPVPTGPRRGRVRISGRIRLLAFTAIVAVVAAGVVAYLVHAHDERQRKIRSAPPVATMPLTEVESAPRIVFRSNARANYGILAMVALAGPDGPRALTGTRCDRLHATATETLCVSLDRTSITYNAQLLDSQFKAIRDLPLGGIPSRARLAPDGSLAATTAFTSVGDTYASANFATRTYISTTGGAKKSLFLEDFTLVHRGEKIAPIDRNYWGVTFTTDNERFYATVGFGGHTYLVRGDIASTTVTTLREDAECPSLSPDGSTLVYKKRLGKPAGQWRLTALNLASGKETALAETRSVDDQVEWLDNEHVLYGMPGSGGDKDIYDVWAVPVDGSGPARVLIPQASSPAVIR